MTELEQQVEGAFDYRGNVTIALKSGETFEAFVFNRHLGGGKVKAPPFVELYRAGKPGQAERVALDQVASITLTGKDHALFVPPPADDA
jgi:hypothetical protein